MGKDEKSRRRAAEKRKKRELEQRRKKSVQNRSAAPEAPAAATPAGPAGYPIAECVISKGWRERGLAHILMARSLGDGLLMVGGYYVDIFCLGIKDSALIEKIREDEYRNTVKPTIFNDPVEFEDCDPGLAMAVAEGAAEFAERYGFKPNKRWPQARRMFQGLSMPEGMPVFGRDDAPCYVKRGETNAQAIIARLERKAGAGNFSVVEDAG